MKKFITILSAFIMIFSLTAFAADEPEIIIDENVYDAISDSFAVSGKILNEIGNAPVNLKITYKGETADEIVYLANASAQKNGNDICFSFEPMNLPLTASGGVYEICVRGEYGGEAKVNFTYSGIGDFLDILKNIQNASTESELFGDNALSRANADKLSVDYGALEKITDKKYFSKLMLAESYTLPEEIFTESDAEKVKEALLKFRTDYKKFIVMASFYNIKSVSESEKWFNDNSEYCGFDNASAVYPYLPAVKNDKFVSRIKTDLSVDTLQKLQNSIEEMILLTSVNTGDQTTVSNVISQFPSHFTGLSSDYGKYSGSVNNKLAGKYFADYAELVAEANSIAAEKKKANSGGSSSSGGGGGSSWGGSTGGVTIGAGAVPDTTPTAPTEKFKDMQSAQWAKTAVYYLCDKGIVSGKTADTFEPNANITRAEFAKLIVMASGKAFETNENAFSDINENDWFFKYVNGAYKLGIVKGNDEGSFNPNDLITRQDMAVMIYRLMGKADENADSSVFSDYESISEYARSAVFALVNDGIINGMGNGTFNPLGFATRAQAAQMLYNMLVTGKN